MANRKLQMLLIDDSPSDVRLLQEALKVNRFHLELRIACDGIEAMQFLREVELGRAKRPDIIILDLNLPKKNGYEVLSDIKSSSSLRHIPVVVMTSSQAEDDVNQAYTLNANCYIAKPETLDQYIEVVRAIEEFWFGTAKLPEPVPAASKSAAASSTRIAS